MLNQQKHKLKYLTHKQILEARKNLFQLADKSNLIKKGNRRLHSERRCCICGRKLTVLDAPTKRYQCIVPHYHLEIKPFLSFNLCQDIKSCVSTLQVKGEK